MLATVIADLVYSAVNEDSLMTEKLRRRGLRIGRHYGVDPFTTVAVHEIMTVETLDAQATVGDARERFAAGGHGAYPVVDAGGELVGIVARGDILRAVDDGAPVLDHVSHDVVTVRPRDPAHVALRAMVDERVEHVPVVDGRMLVGICTRTDLLKVRRPFRLRRSA